MLRVLHSVGQRQFRMASDPQEVTIKSVLSSHNTAVDLGIYVLYHCMRDFRVRGVLNSRWRLVFAFLHFSKCCRAISTYLYTMYRIELAQNAHIPSTAHGKMIKCQLAYHKTGCGI